jgi:hypothetical protein
MDRRGSTHLGNVPQCSSDRNRNRMLSIRVCFEEKLATYCRESTGLLIKLIELRNEIETKT